MTERLPLTAEEQTLAARLARLGPHGEPSPALDARILAAARAELPATPMRKPARWPLAFGVAASLALAVGIAWQLRPMPEAVTYDEAASAMVVEAPTTEAATQATVEPASAVPAPVTPPAPAPDNQQPRLVRTPSPAEPARKTQQAESTAERREPAPIAVEPPAPAAAAADSAAADMALPAPPPSPSPVMQEAPRPFAAPTRERAANAAAQRQGAATEMSSTAAGASDESFVEDVPPATADNPAVRDAWLQRIRELQASGRTADARTSLREFALRYPDYPLPDDLRPLLD